MKKSLLKLYLGLHVRVRQCVTWFATLISAFLLRLMYGERISMKQGIVFEAIPHIYVDASSVLAIGANSIFTAGTRISVTGGSRVSFGDQCKIGKVEIVADRNSEFCAEHHVFVYGLKGTIAVGLYGAGRVRVKKHSMMTCDAYVQGGVLDIGHHTYLNPGTEINCVDRISIGDFCMVSYSVLLYDNNSHSSDFAVRRKEFLDGEKYYGTVRSYRPASAPISIGDDVWLGRNSMVVKGMSVGDRSIVGMGTVVNMNIPADTTVVGEKCRIVEKNSNGRT